MSGRTAFRHGALFACVVVCATFIGGARAQDEAVPAFKSVDSIEARAQGCVTCHGQSGQGTHNGYFPRIAGKPAGYLFNQLVAFRDGTRKYAPMNYLVAYLPDSYLHEIAGHFAKQRPGFAPEDWRSGWARWSVVAVFGACRDRAPRRLRLAASVQDDFSGKGLWASICRAAGVPRQWGVRQAARPRLRSTDVVLDTDMARPGSDAAIGRGATLAQQCTMCHGARGMSDADAPNLAGQYAEVIVKQLTDYQHGDRSSAIMEALARNLSARDMAISPRTTSIFPGRAHRPCPAIRRRWCATATTSPRAGAATTATPRCAT